MPFIWDNPQEMMEKLSYRFKKKRLSLNLSRKTLSSMSGVSDSVIKRFETTGKISLESLLMLAEMIDALPEFATLFELAPEEVRYNSIDEMLADKDRQRGRK